MNLVQPVETHIRVAAHHENVRYAANHTSMSFACNPGGATSEVFSATRVHRMAHGPHTNDDFYAEVIRKCVNNAHAGQSTTIVVCGPPSSGRSQTLYGASGEKGVIELAAEDILKLSGVIATFCGFHCRNGKVRDSVTGSEISIAHHAPPMGATAMAYMRALTSAADAVIVPQRKAADHTCVVSFQIYRPVDSEPRRDMYATINFVDLAAIGDPLPADVAALTTTLERLERGGNPEYSACCLTQLMEPWLVGASTLIGVATVTGKQSLLEHSAATLRFLRRFSRLKQIVTLVQMQVPRQLRDAVLEHERSAAQEGEVVKNAYDRGLADSYGVARQFLRQRCGSASAFDDIFADLAVARRAQQWHTERELLQLQDQVARLQDADIKSSKEAQDLYSRCCQLREGIADEQQHVMQLEIELSTIKNDCERWVSDCNLRRGGSNAAMAELRDAADKLARQHATATVELDRHATKAARLLEGIAQHAQHSALCGRLEALRTKRARLEASLDAAARETQRHNERVRENRERKSRMNRLTNAAARVQCLRAHVDARDSAMRERESCAGSAAPTSTGAPSPTPVAASPLSHLPANTASASSPPPLHHDAPQQQEPGQAAEEDDGGMRARRRGGVGCATSHPPVRRDIGGALQAAAGATTPTRAATATSSASVGEAAEVQEDDAGSSSPDKDAPDCSPIASCSTSHTSRHRSRSHHTIAANTARWQAD